MKLSYEDHGTITVLTISGDLTADQVETFRRSCLDRFTAGVRDMGKILEISRLDRRFNIHQSIESAAKSLR